MLDKHAYAQRAVPRTHLTQQHLTQVRNQVEDDVERRWLVRRWREDGTNRPLVVVLTNEPQLRWILPDQASAAHRFPRVHSRYRYANAYQVNQATGQWTQTRHRIVYARRIAQILPADDKLVRKARAWAVRQRLEGAHATV